MDVSSVASLRESTGAAWLVTNGEGRGIPETSACFTLHTLLHCTVHCVNVVTRRSLTCRWQGKRDACSVNASDSRHQRSSHVSTLNPRRTDCDRDSGPFHTGSDTRCKSQGDAHLSRTRRKSQRFHGERRLREVVRLNRTCALRRRRRRRRRRRLRRSGC